jgi:hypothetical protein
LIRWSKVSISSNLSSVSREFGHAALVVADDIAQVIGGRGCGFCRDERWPSEVVSLSSFAVTLCAILAEYRIRDQRCLGRQALSQGRPSLPAKQKIWRQ